VTAVIRGENRRAALWLTLNRPEAMNGIDSAVVDGIGNALDGAAADPNVRAVVIAAAGPVFCAGADLKYLHALAAAPPEEARSRQDAFVGSVSALFTRIETFGKPVIAAVGGLAVAGGLELVLACDLVVAARAARFGDAHANFGLLPAGGASARLPRRVGSATAKYLMFTGQTLTADQLATTDLVTLLVDDGQLERAVEDVVQQIAAKSSLGIATMKRLIAQAADAPLEASLRAELTALGQYAQSHDFTEGLAAFVAKRTPEFIGR
jgi:enoyl-CoA hydratase